MYLLLQLIATAYGLTQSKCWDFDDVEPTRIRVDHHHAGETKIIIDGSAAWMMLYYRIAIWTYQVYMQCIPRIIVLEHYWGSNVPKDYFYFELLEYIAQIRIQLCLNEKAFLVE